MTIKCPNCKEGSQSPCEKCDAHWNLNEGIEEKDESFAIIYEKEKYWRDELVKVEAAYIQSEANLAISEKIIILAKEEIKKEAEKNAN